MATKMGLDRPLAVQYFEWLGGIARGDLGQSLAQTNVSVMRLIMDRLPVSISLGLWITAQLVPGFEVRGQR
jgi:peptide/nickel transport system permease protein